MAKKLLRMRDRIIISRLTETEDGFGGYTNAPVVQGTYWCKLEHQDGSIEEREGKSLVVTDYVLYFRKKTGELLQKGDVGTIETPAIKVQINSIVEHDLKTYKVMATSVE